MDIDVNEGRVRWRCTTHEGIRWFHSDSPSPEQLRVGSQRAGHEVLGQSSQNPHCCCLMNIDVNEVRVRTVMHHSRRDPMVSFRLSFSWAATRRESESWLRSCWPVCWRSTMLLSDECRRQRSASRSGNKHTRALLLYTKRLDGFLKTSLFSLHALDFLFTEHLMQSTKRFVIRNESRIAKFSCKYTYVFIIKRGKDMTGMPQGNCVASTDHNVIVC